MKSRRITNGNMNIIHCPKLRFTPSCWVIACSAIAFGGVPMGVAIPPMLAATGMLMVNATRPFPLAGRAANTGVRNVSIIAAVAVLETNMEKKPVMRRNPNSTFSLLWPNGRMRFLANSTSRPDFVAAIARIKPPKNRMMTGLAKVAMMSLAFKSSPNASPSPLNTAMELSEIVRHMTAIMTSDVAHEGMASKSQESVAKTKIAIIRCCTIVNPEIPKKSVGRFHTIRVATIIARSCHTFLAEKLLLNRFSFSSDILGI